MLWTPFVFLPGDILPTELNPVEPDTSQPSEIDQERASDDGMPEA